MATFAIFAWPAIALVFFIRMDRAQALIWSTLIGALFLPEGISFDLPGLPPYEKKTAIVAGLLLGLVFTRKSAAARPGGTVHRSAWLVMRILAGVLLLSCVLTVLANPESLVYGPTVIKGLDFRDLLSMLTESLVFLIIFLAAQRHLGDPDNHAALLRAFVLCGVLYSLLVLFEVRMSPQLHQWVYGYFQHIWVQHVRGGGFRPIVFQPHGLWIGVFLLTCALASIALFKTRLRQGRVQKGLLFASFWFVVVLLLSRNFGATALAALFVPLIWLLGRHLQVWVAVIVMSVMLVYPALRMSGVITLESTVQIVGQISAERQQSFFQRVENEADFLERTKQKPLTGWGIWGRWRIHDPETGRDISVSDGRWMSVLGERGWIGYIAYFGLLAVPVLLLPFTARRRALSNATSGIAMIMAATLLYQIPNNTVGPMTLLLAGALSGFAIRPYAVTGTAPAPDPGGRRAPRYSRFGRDGPEAPATARPVEPPSLSRAEARKGRRA